MALAAGLCAVALPVLHWIASHVENPFEYFFSESQRVHWTYLLVAFLIALTSSALFIPCAPVISDSSMATSLSSLAVIFSKGFSFS